MRIIAGGLRGRHVKTFRAPGLKPISGRIKQSLFDILKNLVPGSKVLDLYAGTGAVGIEALSRGAEFAFFVDNDPRCIEQISANLSRMGLAAKARAHKGSAMGDLSWIAYRAGVERFDWAFLGPPYRTPENVPLSYTTPTLEALARSGLIAPGGIVIAQHHKKEDVRAPEGLTAFRQVTYGDSLVDFYRAAG